MRDFAELNSNPHVHILKKSSVDATFIERADEWLHRFESPRFDGMRFVALFVDGKYLVGEHIVLAVGVTEQGFKHPARRVGFIQASTKNSLSKRDLHKRNRSAAQSLEEGLEETLLLHRLAMTEFSTSFATTKCIESVNAQLEHTTRKVTHRQTLLNALGELLPDESKPKNRCAESIIMSVSAF